MSYLFGSNLEEEFIAVLFKKEITNNPLKLLHVAATGWHSETATWKVQHRRAGGGGGW